MYDLNFNSSHNSFKPNRENKLYTEIVIALFFLGVVFLGRGFSRGLFVLFCIILLLLIINRFSGYFSEIRLDTQNAKILVSRKNDYSNPKTTEYPFSSLSYSYFSKPGFRFPLKKACTVFSGDKLIFELAEMEGGWNGDDIYNLITRLKTIGAKRISAKGFKDAIV